MCHVNHFLGCTMKTLAVSLLLLGCARVEPTCPRCPQVTCPDPAKAQTPPQPSVYIDITALRDAAVKAGLPCNNWEQNNHVEGATESASCGADSVLSIYATGVDKQIAIARVRAVHSRFKLDMLLLVGPNWVVNARRAYQLQEHMGGEIEKL